MIQIKFTKTAKLSCIFGHTLIRVDVSVTEIIICLCQINQPAWESMGLRMH